MKQDILNKDVVAEDMLHYGTIEFAPIRLADKSQFNDNKTKLTFTDEYIEAITSDERFINALMLNDNFIKNIKAIVGGIK